MMLDAGHIITFASIVLPLLALVVAEVVRGSPGTPRRYYARFLAFGCVHGFVLWVLFVRGNSHGLPDHWADLMTSLALFLAIGLAVCLTFAAGYLLAALLLDCWRRFLRYARKRKGISIFSKR